MLLFPIALSFSSYVAESQVSGVLLDDYNSAANNTVAAVSKEIRPVLSEEQQRRFDQIEVKVLPESRDLFGIRVGSEGGTPVTYIPLGLIIVQDFIDSAVAATEVGRLDQKMLFQYVKALTSTVRNNSRLEAAGQKEAPLPEFPSFARISPEIWRRTISNENYAATKLAAKLASFSVIVLHELHHHLEPDANVDVREIQADEFAASLSNRVGFNTMSAFYFFVFFAGVEGEQDIAQVRNGYPAPICRAVKLFASGREAAMSDPKFERYMRARGLWDELVAWPDRLQKLYDEEGVACAGSVAAPTASKPPVTAVTKPAIKEASRVDLPRKRMKASTVPPSPGECDGARFKLYVDGRYVGVLDNTRDEKPQSIGVLDVGEHSFRFELVKGFCIDSWAPFQMHVLTSEGSCSGGFVVGESDELQADLRFSNSGAVEHCRLQ